MRVDATLEPARDIGTGFLLGILLFPLVFSWFLLRKGHSAVSRATGFAWLALFVTLGFVVPSASVHPAPATVAGSPRPEDPAMAPSAPRVTAPALHEAYERNEVAADARFKGRVVEIVGVVSAISKDPYDNLFVAIQGGGATMDIHAYFDEAQGGQVASLKTGQTLTIRGRVDGYVMASILVKACRLV